MSDHRVDAIKNIIGNLLPRCTVSASTLPMPEFKTKHGYWRRPIVGESGSIINKGDVYLWITIDKENVVELHVHRSPIALTKREREIFHSFEKTLKGFSSQDDGRAA